jgi:PadR family transcriptional regulator, regulatory protein PadR
MTCSAVRPKRKKFSAPTRSRISTLACGTYCLTYLDVYRLYSELLSHLGVKVRKTELQGTLDLLVLKTLSRAGALHGYGIVLQIQRSSDDLLSVEEGSLYPALHRMQQSGWITSEWAMTETGRKAKYYKLTPTGRKRLQEVEADFDVLVKGVRAVLRYA